MDASHVVLPSEKFQGGFRGTADCWMCGRMRERDHLQQCGRSCLNTREGQPRFPSPFPPLLPERSPPVKKKLGLEET
jgi:hypothetical protein